MKSYGSFLSCEIIALVIVFISCSSLLAEDNLAISQQGSNHQTMIVNANQYIAFLHACAKADLNNLYDRQMSSNQRTACIVRTGMPGQYEYFAIAGRENSPISFVNESDEFAYCDWNGDDLFDDESNIDPYLRSNTRVFEEERTPRSILAMEANSTFNKTASYFSSDRNCLFKLAGVIALAAFGHELMMSRETAAIRRSVSLSSIEGDGRGTGSFLNQQTPSDFSEKIDLTANQSVLNERKADLQRKIEDRNKAKRLALGFPKESPEKLHAKALGQEVNKARSRVRSAETSLLRSNFAIAEPVFDNETTGKSDYQTISLGNFSDEDVNDKPVIYQITLEGPNRLLLKAVDETREFFATWYGSDRITVKKVESPFFEAKTLLGDKKTPQELIAIGHEGKISNEQIDKEKYHPPSYVGPVELVAEMPVKNSSKESEKMDEITALQTQTKRIIHEVTLCEQKIGEVLVTLDANNNFYSLYSAWRTYDEALHSIGKATETWTTLYEALPGHRTISRLKNEWTEKTTRWQQQRDNILQELRSQANEASIQATSMIEDIDKYYEPLQINQQYTQLSQLSNACEKLVAAKNVVIFAERNIQRFFEEEDNLNRDHVLLLSMGIEAIKKTIQDALSVRKKVIPPEQIAIDTYEGLTEAKESKKLEEPVHAINEQEAQFQQRAEAAITYATEMLEAVEPAFDFFTMGGELSDQTDVNDLDHAYDELEAARIVLDVVKRKTNTDDPFFRDKQTLSIKNLEEVAQQTSEIARRLQSYEQDFKRDEILNNLHEITEKYQRSESNK